MPETPSTFAKLPLRRTGTIFSEHSRMAVAIHGLQKSGKTTCAATLDALTRTHMNKRTLFIASEVSDGQGLEAIEKQDIPYVVVKSITDIESVLAYLAEDGDYGGVVWDSVGEFAHNILKPFVLNDTPARESNKLTLKNRQLGVPADSDYQKMGEMLRGWLCRFMMLTSMGDPFQSPKICARRKHVVFTVAQKERSDRVTNKITEIGVDLPGASRAALVTIVKTVARLKLVRRETHREGDKAFYRIESVLSAKREPPYICADRTGLFPDEAPADLAAIYDKFWVPRLRKV